jgi:LysR family hydrogen peroxide-inducible transcriptional activator
VLGISLAERTKRVVLMTPLGIEIARRVRLVLRDAEDVMALAAEHHEPMTGEMRLGVIPTVGPFLLARTLPALNAAYPALRLYLREDQTLDLLDRLRAGDIDLALIALPFETEDLAVRILFEDGFQFACHTSHPLARRKGIANADLTDQPLLLLEDGHCLRGHALDACFLNEGQIRLQFEATSLNTLVQMVAAGLGVTLLPQLAIDADIVTGSDICLVPLSTRASRQIGLVWRPSSPHARTFDLLAPFFSPANR